MACAASAGSGGANQPSFDVFSCKVYQMLHADTQTPQSVKGLSLLDALLSCLRTS